MKHMVFHAINSLLVAFIILNTPLFHASADLLVVVPIQVDTVADYNDLAHAACTPAGNDCSLRGAVRRANGDLANYYIIDIPAGVYTLSIPGQAENDNFTGDLDVRVALTLHGAGSGNTYIQAGAGINAGIDRVIHAIYAGGYSLTLSQLTVRYGKPPIDSYGGGIFVQGMYSVLLLERVNIEDNVTSGSDGQGGGIYTSYRLVMVESTVAHNISGSHGGGIYTQTDSAGLSRITGSAIIYNQSGGQGAGIMANSQLEISNSTLSGNQAAGGEGGGLALGGSADVVLRHVTLAYNTSPGNSGWAIDNPLSLALQNTLVVGGEGGSACSHPAATASGSLGTDASCGTPVSNTPGLLPLALNGGLTLNHALITGSPAIDAGENAMCLPFDQRGKTRPIDGNSDGINACDAGAFEVPASIWLPIIQKTG